MVHGHTGRTVSRQLARAIGQLRANGVVPTTDPLADGWAVTPEIFCLHLTRLKEMTDSCGGEECEGGGEGDGEGDGGVEGEGGGGGGEYRIVAGGNGDSEPGSDRKSKSERESVAAGEEEAVVLVCSSRRRPDLRGKVQSTSNDDSVPTTSQKDQGDV